MIRSKPLAGISTTAVALLAWGCASIRSSAASVCEQDPTWVAGVRVDALRTLASPWRPEAEARWRAAWGGRADSASVVHVADPEVCRRAGAAIAPERGGIPARIIVFRAPRGYFAVVPDEGDHSYVVGLDYRLLYHSRVPS